MSVGPIIGAAGDGRKNPPRMMTGGERWGFLPLGAPSPHPPWNGIV